MNFTFTSDHLSSGDKQPSSGVVSASRVLLSGVPKFKSTPPPSLPISSPSSSFFSIPPGLSPAELLDSPVLLNSSSILPSPTTGALIGQSFNWKINSNPTTAAPNYNTREDNFYPDFTFQTQPQSSSEAVKQEQTQSYQQEQKPWSFQDQKSESNGEIKPQTVQRNSDDGYNWRKYGQKQVKASENPRSYYKCTFPGCPTKKKVEKSLDGQITEIVYKGTHTHPKPVKARRSSSSSASMALAIVNHSEQGKVVDGQENSFGSGQIEPNSVGTPENSSISIADDEIERGSQRSRSVGDEFDGGEEVFHGGDEREAKRWKGEAENECMSAATGNRTVREPRVVVQTKSDIDILDDGYRWRKYGQKVVKGNPNPRSYYKCTYPSCSVRKHVERAAHDLGSVITTYEGKHNHDIPAARGSSHLAARVPPPNPDNAGSLTIRPSALNYAANPSNNLYNLPYNSRVGSSSEGQSPFFLEMIQNPAGGFDFSSLGNSMGNVNQQQPQQLQYNNAATKEEPRDDLFFESLLY
uniref:WRKY transcription factor n=1 Tax=Fagopyrum tataricum TaxID=62330 RepID=A0A4P9Q2T6_FAGTA|nr:WRKY transcription factor [Fagopyrum tataricum]